MLTILLICKALWGGESGRTPRLVIALWTVLSLCMPFQMAVPVAFAGVTVDGLEMNGWKAEALMDSMHEAAIQRMPEFRVLFQDVGLLLEPLTPENATVVTSMEQFRELVRLAER